MTKQKEHHILSLSGGKDSTALAFFIKDNMPEVFEQMELVFCDTGLELDEVYDYLNKIEIFLGKKITRIKPHKSFDDYLLSFKILPSPFRRWCTILLKTQPFRNYVLTKIGDETEKAVIKLYIGITFDEKERALGAKFENVIQEQFPFIEHRITAKDGVDILNKAGIGLPDFYQWKSRSGCYLCFYQSKLTWVRLYERHPDLYKKAMNYEHAGNDLIRDGWFGWNREMLLKDLIKPENIQKIKAEYAARDEKKQAKSTTTPGKLVNMYGDYLVDEDENKNTCLFCHI